MFELDEELQQTLEFRRKTLAQAKEKVASFQEKEDEEWTKFGRRLKTLHSVQTEKNSYVWMPSEEKFRQLFGHYGTLCFLFENQTFIIVSDLSLDTYYIYRKSVQPSPAFKFFKEKKKKVIPHVLLATLNYAWRSAEHWYASITSAGYASLSELETLYTEISEKLSSLLENQINSEEENLAFKKLANFK